MRLHFTAVRLALPPPLAPPNTRTVYTRAQSHSRPSARGIHLPPRSSIRAEAHHPLPGMGRKKQAQPRRSGGIIIASNGQDNTKSDLADENVVANEKAQKGGLDISDPPVFVDVERTCWALDEHFDISELVLTDLNIGGGFSGFRVENGFYQSSDYSFRFRVCNVNEFVARIKLGHWPVLSSKDVHLELVEKYSAENRENQMVVLSGSFDGPNEGVSGLAHLASLKFMSVRPLEEIAFSEDMTTLRVRVEILKSAFDACESLHDNTRQLWKKSMINVMAWLRPEVMTSEARYGICQSRAVGNDLHPDERDSATVNRKGVKFDVSGFYEAIKPSKADPMLDDNIPNLLPKLRPYQRRAAYWMVQREKGALGSFGTKGTRVRNTSFSEEPAVEVHELVSYDIVLTTYEVLKEDLSHDSDRHEGDRRFMRYQKRYPVIPTPLTRIFWWRLCLDEAQMVESNTAAATEMALRLHSKHRWCITGTPIQRRLDDLYGLLKFLKLSPFDVPRWWNEVIRDPYERRDAGAMEFTHSLFKQIMWRSSKRHVADELHLPPQEECLSWLSFSAIEEHFYQRQHETCVDYARELIESLKADILKREAPGSASSAPSDCLITHVEAAKLLNSLLKLRQACCHPQVGSYGLRSLQQSPMSMEEVLTVLIGKTKIEGEEALRRSVVALNGLAGIAIIEDNSAHAVSLYKEALDLAMEHSEDFSLDPLLNIHIHHNLSEILFKASNGSLQIQLNDGQTFGSPRNKASKRPYFGECDNEHTTKRQKLNGIEDDGSVSNTPKAPTSISEMSVDALHETNECNAKPSFASNSFSYDCLKTVCESFKQKFLSIFNSKLIVAQLDFKKSYEQVCDAFSEMKNQGSVWWLDVLHHIEQSRDSTNELIRKIGEAVLGSTNNSRSSKIGSSFRSIHGLKYYIQTGLDSLEVSRRAVLDRLLEIDETMEKPRDEDIERVGHCQNCQPNGNGPVCILCELDELFQIYEARLFRLSNAHGGIIMSAEEALDLQKKKSALNQFYRTLSQANKNSSSTSRDEEITGKRDTGEKVVVSKSPSELEVVLGVIRSYSKVHLGKEGKSAATKQLRLLEDMRKEYASARSLCIAQAQVLRAHDEIKMSTTRLRLREDENDKSLDALSVEELPANSVHYSNEKFISLALLLRIKGKLRYLKGLVQAKQKASMENTDSSFLTQETATCQVSPMEQKNEHSVNACQEACPICHEKISIQKMVFQCGHVTCCKCLFELTEHKQAQAGESQRRWVMCPTCRQHTEFANIAYADDGQNKLSTSPGLHESQDSRNEASITVHGSYGTKIEAVTRRILWIKSTETNAKVLVFSSWKDVLDVLEHAFKANGISYARMKGGRKAHTAVGHFRGQNASVKVNKGEHCQDIQVLLLLVQHGANGLNLLEARHVILVEPLLNPAAEAQAISRVHRIGQENKTLVHRFIVKDSVEESIYKLNKSRNSSSFISGNTKNQDQPVLTLKDVESLFAASPANPPQTDERPMESLMHLPPSMAAAVAAERRLQEQTASHIS
ncbi:uncharacterized protein LOC115679829 isoform X5 [Syzygium oleosum]|uniref:uncharacterized protein LOC115679829 isoform X5 n=1 Tax=Syzygium oleosum TaxID=219896 RepID=UPI0024B8A522|nr:uncharacterized protein LOC115679829 isoform X5 [Syzygium oleosum]